MPRRDFKTPPPLREVAALVAVVLLTSLAALIVVEACVG